MISVHDNNIYAYCILCQQQQIVLHTEYAEGEQPEYTDVVFSGVLAHHLRWVLSGNILFGIEEVEPQQIYRENQVEFEQGKHYRWPEVVYATGGDLIERLQQQGIHGYELHSSYGLWSSPLI